MQTLASILVSIILGLFMKCGASPTSCQDSSEEEWFTSWNEFHDSSLLKLKPCDNFKSMCAHSLQVICESRWRLNVSSHSVNGWRDAPVLMEDGMYSYTLDVGSGESRQSLGVSEGKFIIEHTYRYGCQESEDGSGGNGVLMDPSTICEPANSVWQSTRIITTLIPTVQIEISSGSEITGGETVRLLCLTNLPSSHKILMRFEHNNSQVAYCHTFQESPEQYNEWTIYRDDSESQHCVLEIENVTYSSSGVYTCTGFLPDGTQLHSSENVSIEGMPSITVTEPTEDGSVHIIALWTFLIFVLILVIVLSLIVIIIVKQKINSSKPHVSFHGAQNQSVLEREVGAIPLPVDSGSEDFGLSESLKETNKNLDIKARAISRASDGDHILLKSTREGQRANSNPEAVWSGRQMSRDTEHTANTPTGDCDLDSTISQQQDDLPPITCKSDDCIETSTVTSI